MILSSKKLYSYFANRYLIRQGSNGWWVFDCPFCINGANKEKCAVNFDYSFVKCWVCAFSEGALEFVMQSEGLKYRDARNLINEQDEASVDLEVIEGIVTSKEQLSDVQMPTGYTGLLEGNGVLARQAVRYLHRRGFNVELLDSMGFGYCNKHDENFMEDYFGYIIIPFKSKGKLRYFIGRDFRGGDKKYKYKNPKTEKFGIGKADLLFNEDALQLYKRVWVSEGWADAMTMGKAGVATMGWSLSGTQKAKIMRGSCEELVFVPDFGYYAKAVEIAMEFLDVKKAVKVLNMDLITDSIRNDANAVGYDEVYKLYKETVPLTLESAVEAIM